MTSGPTFDDMAVALSAATMDIDTVEIQSRLTAAGEVMAEVPVLDLVAVAYGAPAPDAYQSVESAVHAHDGTWVTGRRQAVVRIVAAAAVTALLRDTDRRLFTALACQSASYLGFEVRNDQLGELADAAVLDESTGGRARTAIAVLRDSSKRLLQGAKDLDGPQAVSAVRALARRFEEVTEQVSNRLDRMDEELNTLWWSRKRVHSESGDEWTSVPSPQRIVRAALEIEEFVTIAPAARGTIEVLNEVIGDLGEEQTIPLVDVAAELANTAHSGSPLSHALLPVTSMASALQKFKNDREVASSVIEQSTGLDPSRSVSLGGLGEQLLREHSMMRVS